MINLYLIITMRTIVSTKKIQLNMSFLKLGNCENMITTDKTINMSQV